MKAYLAGGEERTSRRRSRDSPWGCLRRSLSAWSRARASSRCPPSSQGRSESPAVAREVLREGLQPAQEGRRGGTTAFTTRAENCISKLLLHQQATHPSSGRRPRKRAWARNHFKHPQQRQAQAANPSRGGQVPPPDSSAPRAAKSVTGPRSLALCSVL